jgi:hypothetical protein
MNKFKSWQIVVALIVGGVAVFGGMFFFVGPLLSDSGSSDAAVVCSHTGTVHTATIKDEKITPRDIQANTCDVLTIINEDSKSRLMAFGKHDDHISYNGVGERRLAQGQKLSVTLTEKGTYLFHDHFDESVTADFTVK